MYPKPKRSLARGGLIVTKLGELLIVTHVAFLIKSNRHLFSPGTFPLYPYRLLFNDQKLIKIKKKFNFLPIRMNFLNISPLRC
jgi:hypothetical protein